MENETKIIDISVNYSKAVNDLIATKNAITELKNANVELSKDMATNGGQVLVNNAQIKNLTSTLNINTKAVREEIAEVKGAEGAYQKLDLQYQLAAKDAKDLAARNILLVNATSEQHREADIAAKKANALNDQLKALDKTVGQNQRSVGDYKDQIIAAVKELTTLKNETSKMEVKQKQLSDSNKENTREYKELSNAISENKSKIAGNVKAIETSRTEIQKFGVNAKQTAKELKELGFSSEYIAKELKIIDAEASKGGNSIKDLGKQFLSMIGVTAIIGGIASAFKNALNTITEFDQSMANVSAITMATKEEMKQLREIAIQYGTSTKFTASEVAGLEVELGKLGYTTQQIIDATGGVAMAAAATGESLQKTAEIVGSVTMAFGLSAGESQRVADVMSQSFNSTALGLDNFSEAIKYVAPVAKQAGVSLEETTALLGILANNGIKGSMAGTALRQIMGELVGTGGNLQDKLKELAKTGLNLAGAQDEVGRSAKTSLLILKDNTAEIPKLTEAFVNSAGASEIAAAKMMDTIAGKTNFLGSTWESFILSIENGNGRFANSLKFMLDKAAEAVSGLQRLLMSQSDIDKMDAKNSAQSRLKDFEKRAQSQKDYTKYLNEEIIAEKGVYQAKLTKVEQLKAENQQTGEWITKTEKYLSTSRDVNFERTKNLAAAKVEFENKNKEIKGLTESVNKSVEYVNVLGNLRRSKADATALDLKNTAILEKNNSLGEAEKKKKKESFDFEKALRESNAKGVEDSMNREIEIVKSTITTKQDALNVAHKKKLVTEKEYGELSKAYEDEQDREISSIKDKYWMKDAQGLEKHLDELKKTTDKQLDDFWAKIKSTDEYVLSIYKGEVDTAANKYDLLKEKGIEDAEAHKALLEAQRQFDVENAKKTGEDELSINAKYAQLKKNVDTEAFNAKLDMASSVTSGLATLLGKETKAGKLAAAATVGIEGAKSAFKTGAQAAVYFASGNIPMGILAGVETGIIIANTAKSIADIYKVNTEVASVVTGKSDTVSTTTTKLHTGGVDTPDNNLRSDEITRTLLKSERVLSPVQTGIFDNIIRNVSLQGGSNNITSNIGTNQIDQTILLKSAMIEAFKSMPPTQLSLVEWNNFQARQLLLEENRVIK